jgi:hypothetical protein
MTRDLIEDYHGNLPEEDPVPENKVTKEDLAKIYGTVEEKASASSIEGLSFESTNSDVVKVKIGEKTYSLVASDFIEKTNKHMQHLYARILRLERERVEDVRALNNLRSTSRQSDARIKQLSSRVDRGSNTRSFESE